MDWALGVFPKSLLYTGAPLWPEIGAFVGSFGSGVGLVQTFAENPRILQHYDELSKVSEKFKIHGSGQDFLAAINTLFEKTSCPSNITKGVRIVPEEAHCSLLGATTPDMWLLTFGGTGTEGSGFFQRLNIVSSEDTRTVPRLRKPDLSQFSGLVDQVKALKDRPYILKLSPEADALLDRWQTEWIRIQPDTDDVTGRLQVLVQRNAIHLGWLLGDRVDSVEVIKRAIAVSNHQLRIRRQYKPVMGDSPWAVMENLLVRKVQSVKRIERSELYRKVNASRVGLEVFNRSIANLAAEGVFAIEKSSSQGRGRKAEIVVWCGN
jgi:hypothetical protein